MTKYRILDAPDQKPGKCANCGSCKKDGRKYCDFGLLVDWYGIVFLCGHCVHDIANSMSVSLIAKLEAELKATIEKAVTLEEVQEEGQQLFEKITKSFEEFNALYTGQFGGLPDNSSGMGSGEASSESGTNKTEPRTNKTEQRASQPSTSSRRSNVPSLTELLDKSEQH